MVRPFRVVVEFFMQVVREEKQFEDAKHDNELDKNNGPKGPPKLHAAKSFKIKNCNMLDLFFQFVTLSCLGELPDRPEFMLLAKAVHFLF